MPEERVIYTEKKDESITPIQSDTVQENTIKLPEPTKAEKSMQELADLKAEAEVLAFKAGFESLLKWRETRTKQLLELENRTKELDKKEADNAFKWQDTVKKQLLELEEQRKATTESGIALEERETTLADRETLVEKRENTCDRVEKGLHKKVDDYNLLSQKDKNSIAPEIEKMLEFLCSDIPESTTVYQYDEEKKDWTITYPPPYVREPTDRALNGAFCIAKKLLEGKCGIPFVVDTDGIKYLSLEKRRQRGLRRDGSKYTGSGFPEEPENITEKVEKIVEEFGGK
jgi:hypothetical protein